MIDADRLRELLHYDPATGTFTWKVDRRGTAKAGTAAGSVHPDGYRSIKVDRKVYLAHRLAFLYMTGRMPADQIDHIDRDRSNDRWSNLRSAKHGENRQNSKAQRRFRGVYPWNSGFMAVIQRNGVRRYLGMFTSEREAAIAYDNAAREFRTDFTRFNFTASPAGDNGGTPASEAGAAPAQSAG